MSSKLDKENTHPQAIGQQSDLHQKMIEWRHWLHQHPELSFKEVLTSDYIASVLAENDIEMHRGLATTGIVATIQGKKAGGSIGLRADMDALPILERNEFAHKSLHHGKMHACGHDGHSTMLLGAAVYLKQNNNFNGTVHCIFQPAEEGGRGGKEMVDQGLFDKFPCDSVYGMHNWPGLEAGKFAVHDKAVMAAHFEDGYPATINTPEFAKKCAESAAKIVGNGNVLRDLPPSMGAEDFSYILNANQGAYIWIGNGEVPEGQPEGGCMLHNTQYDFNDDVSASGASYWVQLVNDILN